MTWVRTFNLGTSLCSAPHGLAQWKQFFGYNPKSIARIVSTPAMTTPRFSLHTRPSPAGATRKRDRALGSPK
eukprot:scaffold633_cov321-Pavlova_lutheri.AAC.21